MGELSKKDAETKCDNYLGILKECRSAVREDFEEMDFLNACQRNQMEGYIGAIETEISTLTEILDKMEFE